jgi:Mrp family chromosome partitioning ATPase
LRQSAAILESNEMRRLMEDVRERFDLVILDTSSLSLSNDPLLIQPYSDGIVLVTRPNLTQENMLVETIDQLVESELGLLGVIVNGADILVSQSHSFTDEEKTRIFSEISVHTNNK